MCPDPLMVSALWVSALCRLVGEIEGARAKRPRVHELQRLLIAPDPPFLEERRRPLESFSRALETKLVVL
jgi:hypothetical protein